MVPGSVPYVALDDRLLTQMRKGVLEYCVLAVIRDGSTYGREIAEALSAGGTLLASEGTIYPLLSRLRRQQLVGTTWQESAAGPPRRYYTLTDDGRDAVAAFEATWAAFRRDVDAVIDTEETR